MVRAYGKLAVPKALRPNKNKEQRATRVCWFLVHGMWPGDLHVLHTCDNPPCVQPAHLWLGTIDDNQKDSMRKGRRPTGDAHGLRLHPDAVKRGEANPMATITAEQVQIIRAYGRLGYPHWQIAHGLHLPRHTIRNVLRRVSWTHLPDTQDPHFVNRLGPIQPVKKQAPGEDNPNARLTSEGVRAIRAELAEGLTHRRIAERYHVSQSLISLIARRRIWAHID
jgi:DNA invertase Pin-like site-specific DNA recombinase